VIEEISGRGGAYDLSRPFAQDAFASQHSCRQSRKRQEKEGPRENYPLFSTFRDSTAAHAEPTFLQFIIGLTRHQYRRIPSNYSDRFHHQRRWTTNWY
jgi:hypothetical protein